MPANVPGTGTMAERKLIAELEKHLQKLSARLGKLSEPLHAYLAGGTAVNYYTGHRMSRDVDIKWSHRVPLPADMQLIEVEDTEIPEEFRVIAMDGGFTDFLGSFPPEWERNSRVVGRIGDIVLHIIEPVDLAVSKVARFQDRDREDIRQLAKIGLVDFQRFAERMDEALDYYVGDTTFIKYNADDAKTIVREAIDGKKS